MTNIVSESSYDLKFRSADAKKLGEHLRLRHSVELIGMKRVGISNFLRFFLYHQGITNTYINHGEKHLFVPVDLNDLVQLKISAFWILVFKRLVDSVEGLPEQLSKNTINHLFLQSIQSQNIFLTIENIKKALAEIVNLGIYPTFFFIRFDKLAAIVTDEFFGNLQGLIDASVGKLAYVFTSFKSLDQISPQVFPRQALLTFSHLLYIQPAVIFDMKIIFETFLHKYQLSLKGSDLNELIKLSGGHVQYLQLALIILNEEVKAGRQIKTNDLFPLVAQDERIVLQSEEIWDSLQKSEHAVLKKVINQVKLTPDDCLIARYLWDTGIIRESKDGQLVFSELFLDYLRQNHHSQLDKSVELTKKESELFEMLQKNLNQVSEREQIISHVWPEYEELGVSNWTVDRLVARLREKLKKQKSPYQLITIRTRGYKLIQI